MAKGRSRMGHIQRVSGTTSDYEKAEDATRLPQTVLEAELVRGDPDKGKRFRKAGGGGHVVRRPHLDALLATGYTTAMEELRRLSNKAKVSALDADEIRRYSTLVDAVTKLSRTEQAAYPNEDEELTREELIERGREAMAFLDEGDEEEDL